MSLLYLSSTRYWRRAFAPHLPFFQPNIFNSMKNILFISLIFLTGQASAQSADTLKSFTFEVKNLHCDGDMPAIQKNLLNQEGIDEVSFTKRKKQASVFTVLFHTAATRPEQIKAAVENTAGCDAPDEKPYRVGHAFEPKIATP